MERKRNFKSTIIVLLGNLLFFMVIIYGIYSFNNIQKIIKQQQFEQDIYASKIEEYKRQLEN